MFFPSNIVLNVVFYVLFVEYCSKCRFLCSFRRNSEFLPIFSNLSIPNFSIPNFSIPNFSIPNFFIPNFFKVKMTQRCWSAPGPLPPVYLCLAAPLRHCPIDSYLLLSIEHLFCSFCEQKQRINGAVAHCSTWNNVHFVNRNSAAALLHVEHCSFCEQKQRSNGTTPQRLTINIAVRARGDMRH